MDNPIGMMVLIVGVVIVIILMIVLALRNGRQHDRLLAEDEEMANGLLLQRGLDEDLLSQERELAAERERIAVDKARRGAERRVRAAAAQRQAARAAQAEIDHQLADQGAHHDPAGSTDGYAADRLPARHTHGYDRLLDDDLDRPTRPHHEGPGLEPPHQTPER